MMTLAELPRKLIYDYDDTLGGVRFENGSIHPGAEAYFDCIKRFGAYMNSVGLNGERAKQLQHDIDLNLAKLHGFADKTRFASSFKDAYKMLARETFTQAEADESYAIGMSVFTAYPYAALEGALEVLDITSRFYDIIIVTKGETAEQHKKLRETGVGAYADEIFVVGKKDENDWNEVLASLGFDSPESAAESWAIGNSAKADVNPLLRRGFNGIEIAEKNKWAFEAAAMEEPMVGRQAHTVTDISDVLRFIPLPNHITEER